MTVLNTLALPTKHQYQEDIVDRGIHIMEVQIGMVLNIYSRYEMRVAS